MLMLQYRTLPGGMVVLGENMDGKATWTAVGCMLVSTVGLGGALAVDATALIAPGWPGLGGWLIPVGLIVALVAIFVPVVQMGDRGTEWSAFDGAFVTAFTSMLPVSLTVQPLLAIWWTAPLREVGAGPAIGPAAVGPHVVDALIRLAIGAPWVALAVWVALTAIGFGVARALGARLRPPPLADRVPWLALVCFMTGVWALLGSASAWTTLASGLGQVWGPSDPRHWAVPAAQSLPIFLMQGAVVMLVVCQLVRAIRGRRLWAVAPSAVVLVGLGSLQSALLFLIWAPAHLAAVLALTVFAVVGGAIWGWYAGPMGPFDPAPNVGPYLLRGLRGGLVVGWVVLALGGLIAAVDLWAGVVGAIPSLGDAAVVQSGADMAGALWPPVALTATVVLGVGVALGVGMGAVHWAINQLPASRKAAQHGEGEGLGPAGHSPQPS